MLEISIPIAPPPGSPDNPVAFINNTDLFAALAAGETYLAPGNVVELIFNVAIDPAVFMTKFQISTNADTVDVTAKLKDLVTSVDLTVILLKHTHIYFTCSFEQFQYVLEKLCRTIQRFTTV